MTKNEDAAEDLLEEAKQKQRTTSEATSTDTAATPGRTEAIKEALLSVEDGETPENINVRDARLKALLVGLEDAGELSDVAQSLAETLDTDSDDREATQSDVARLLIRVGLQEALPDLLADATEARQRAALEQASDF
jgi:hypothetical protein